MALSLVWWVTSKDKIDACQLRSATFRDADWHVQLFRSPLVSKRPSSCISQSLNIHLVCSQGSTIIVHVPVIHQRLVWASFPLFILNGHVTESLLMRIEFVLINKWYFQFHFLSFFFYFPTVYVPFRRKGLLFEKWGPIQSNPALYVVKKQKNPR